MLSLVAWDGCSGKELCGELAALPVYEIMLHDASPWQKVVSDLFHLKGDNYIVVVGYFSRYPEVIKLKGGGPIIFFGMLKTCFCFIVLLYMSAGCVSTIRT